MSKFVIQGGRPISGVHRTPGNKNAALPMLAACLLTSDPVTLRNLPLIADVMTMLHLLEGLGADVHLDKDAHTVTVCAKQIHSTCLDQELCGKVRASILFAGPLLGRYGSATLYPPGGDVIGRRRIDTHIDGFQSLGTFVETNGVYAFHAPHGLTGRRILLDEASVTATENLLMAAALAKGTTVLYNTACEPHVQDLGNMLNAMGAHIEGLGTNLVTVEGVDSLHGTTFDIGPDYIDAGSYLVAALVTNGELTVEGVSPADFAVLEKPFRRFGARWTLDEAKRSIHVPFWQLLATSYDFGDAIPKIEDGTWPQFPSDLLSVLIVLATQVQGTTLFFEKMFESRLYFVDHLIGMGARIVQCDPHRVVVTGPTKLNGSRVASPDIRAGMTLLIAALCAKGETVILNADSIDRGYEAIDTELRRLGAAIERETDG
ncbi:MAG: UDP-N-acetylglucosamine 1-carboxyvinyltransferase [Kiritimatiellae bacterium]|nr:UDP-N-acetylglucosamine 1-carboxyvinyltransferase [Kiritimatiellia bacterium]